MAEEQLPLLSPLKLLVPNIHLISHVLLRSWTMLSVHYVSVTCIYVNFHTLVVIFS